LHGAQRRKVGETLSAAQLYPEERGVDSKVRINSRPWAATERIGCRKKPILQLKTGINQWNEEKLWPVKEVYYVYIYTKPSRVI
jgi:hypothetical protein